jgi:hypothetical protein
MTPHEADAKYLTPEVVESFARLIVAVEIGSGPELFGCIAQLVNMLIENRNARPRARDQALCAAIARLP